MRLPEKVDLEVGSEVSKYNVLTNWFEWWGLQWRH